MLVSSMKSPCPRFLQGTRDVKRPWMSPRRTGRRRADRATTEFLPDFASLPHQHRKWSNESGRGGKKLTRAPRDGSFNLSILAVTPVAARPLGDPGPRLRLALGASRAPCENCLTLLETLPT